LPLLEWTIVRLVVSENDGRRHNSEMEPQGRTIASPSRTRRQSKTLSLEKTTLRRRDYVQTVGLNAETKKDRHRAEGEIFVLTFPLIGLFRLPDKSGVDRTNAELCETIRPRQREVPHEIPNHDMGCCGLSCCEWLGGLFLSKRQGPSDRTVGVCSSSANLSHCNCRNALPREHLFVSCCKCCHVCSGRSTGGNRAAAIKPLKLIEDISVREFRFNAKSAISYWEELVREADLPGASERSNWNHAPGWSRNVRGLYANIRTWPPNADIPFLLCSFVYILFVVC